MTIFSLLTLIGGLALFLFGMNIMGDGLIKVSGGRLDSILERLTSNRFKGVLLGAGVTAIIQSSSVSTVMVVGFVNSGIMKLTQAVGVIMGANIGTTVTSWLLSLTGISGSNFFIQMLKPASFSPILALIGIILLMTARGNAKRKDISFILLGFAVLMFGMTTMSDAVSPLADNEQFVSILTVFSNPILGVLAGAGLTAAIQSSSASIGILQALCITGAVPFSAAIPIIMGQNIGTCVTALISSIGAGTNAKRVAMIHLYFNLIGTVGFMIIFYAINHFVGFAFLAAPATVTGIAIIHSLFNIICTVVLFPFGNFLVKLATFTIPGKKEQPAAVEQPDELAHLENRFLEKPAYAVKVCWDTSVKMVSLVRDAVALSIDLIQNGSEQTAAQILSLEQRVDKYEEALSIYLMKVSNKNLWPNDSVKVSIMLQCIRDFERIADHTVNITYLIDDMHTQGVRITKGGMKELMVYAQAIQDIVDQMIKVFENNDLALARSIEPFEEVIEHLSIELKQRHVNRLRRGKCSLEAGLILEDILMNLARISDHCSNVGAYMIRVSSHSEYDAPALPEQFLEKNNQWFREEYARIKENYVLPVKKQKAREEQSALPEGSES